MSARRLILACTLILGSNAWAAAQFIDSEPKAPYLGETVTERWRVGVVVTGGGAPLRNVTATTSALADWDDQKVRVVDEEFSPGVRVTYRMVDDAVKQMIARIPSLLPGRQAKAVVTFEVERACKVAPDDTDGFRLPDPRRLDRKMRPFLAPSPYIESTHPEIKALAQRIGVDEPLAWDRVEAIYDWVRQTIEYRDNQGGRVLTTLETLREGTGDCDELSSLFIAVCRAASIPARTVRVPGHCYPEFYLVDEEGRGHWFPCQASGSRAFGGMPDDRPVMQKGDSLRVYNAQTRRTEHHRFLPEMLTIGSGHPGATPPKFEIVLEPVEE